jgi:hypothetical protein
MGEKQSNDKLDRSKFFVLDADGKEQLVSVDQKKGINRKEQESELQNCLSDCKRSTIDFLLPKDLQKYIKDGNYCRIRCLRRVHREILHLWGDLNEVSHRKAKDEDQENVGRIDETVRRGEHDEYTSHNEVPVSFVEFNFPT